MKIVNFDEMYNFLALFLAKVYFSLSTFTKIRFYSLNSKTEQTTSLSFSNFAFYLLTAISKAVLLQRMVIFATVTVVLSFSVFNYSVEFLKNRSKSQKNHKIENSILLDSI